MKVVINRCFGGFGLSLRGQKRLGELLGKDIYFYKQEKYDSDGEDTEYKKINDLAEGNMFIHAVTKDLGDICSSKELSDNYFTSNNVERNNPLLIQVVEELKEEVNGLCSDLIIVEIPDGIEYEIDDYDGMETVEECHRSWY